MLYMCKNDYEYLNLKSNIKFTNLLAILFYFKVILLNTLICYFDYHIGNIEF